MLFRCFLSVYQNLNWLPTKKKLTLAVSQHTRILLDGAQETYYSSDLRKHSQTSQSFVCSAEILLFLWKICVNNLAYPQQCITESIPGVSPQICMSQPRCLWRQLGNKQIITITETGVRAPAPVLLKCVPFELRVQVSRMIFCRITDKNKAHNY